MAAVAPLPVIRLVAGLVAASALAALLVGESPPPADAPEATATTTPAWLTGATPGRWMRIPSAVMSASPVMADLGTRGRPDWNPGLHGVDGFAYTSGDLDVRDSKFYLFAPGGHGYATDDGNESWNGTAVLDLEADAPQWAVAAPSSPMRVRTYNGDGHYADGRPAATHSYNFIHYIPSRNRVFRLSATTVYGDGNHGGLKTASLDTTTGVYDPQGYSAPLPVDMERDGVGVRLPNEDVLLSRANGERVVWRAATMTFERLPPGSIRGSYGNAVLDTRRGRVFNPNPPGQSDQPGAFMTDATTFEQTRFPLSFSDRTLTEAKPPWGGEPAALGMAFYQHPTDPGQDYYVLANANQLQANGACWKVNAVTGAVSALDASNRTGVAMETINKPYGRFRYVPRLGGIVYLSGPSSAGAWFLPLAANR